MCPVVIAIIAGIAGLVIAWLLSDVFVVFGVELGPHVVAWAGCGCAIDWFGCYAVQHRGVLRAVAVALTVFAVLSAYRHRSGGCMENMPPSDHCSAKTPILTGYDTLESSPGSVLGRDLGGFLRGGDARWSTPTRADVEALTPGVPGVFGSRF